MPGLFSFPKTSSVSTEPFETPWRLEAALRTDVGCVRDTNEDYIRLVDPRAGDPHATQGMLLVVADGMGGHAAGEVASALAVDTIHRAFYASNATPGTALRQALEAANTAVWTAGQQPDRKGMGTTVTALVLQGDRGYVAHVGDSRLYRLRNGRLQQITHDHSLVQAMVRQGMLAPDAAAHHHDRNVLLQALGNNPSVDVDVLAEPLDLHVGDTFLVSTDGLHDGLSCDELEGLLLEHADLQHTADALVAVAKSRGGTDNISVGLVRLAALDAGSAASAHATREIAPPYPASS